MVFYDPLFPEVCKLCTSPLCIGVTTNVAFELSKAGSAAVSPFLEKLAEDVAAFRRNPAQVLSLLALLVQKCKYRHLRSCRGCCGSSAISLWEIRKKQANCASGTA